MNYKYKVSEREKLLENKPRNFLGFTRDNLAIGIAGFVAGVVTLPIPGRAINPVVEGEMTFRGVFGLLELHLPGSKLNTKK